MQISASHPQAEEANMTMLTSNQVLRDSVMRELDRDPLLDAGRIGVTAREGSIVLSGDAASYPEKDAALRAAERVYGVRAVADSILVKLPGERFRDDEDIADEVISLLHWNTVIPDSVQAEVRDGNVILRGEVAAADQREEAEGTVRCLAGVHDVTNEITLRSSGPADPAETHHSA
jgi:osmotically-inducible protein OsmY